MSKEADSSSSAKEGTSGAYSFWGFGTSLVESVAENAKQGVSSFVNTIIETDWQKELQDIQDGLKNDKDELEQHVGKQLGLGQNQQSSRGTVDASFGTTAIADLGRRFLTGTAEIVQQISAMQRNSATYCDEPEDTEAFSTFLANYDAAEREEQAKDILSTNPFMSELYSRLVPLVISHETFWQRYFFRLQRLTAEVEKVQERLQQAHRHAEARDTDAETLESLTATSSPKNTQADNLAVGVTLQGSCDAPVDTLPKHADTAATSQPEDEKDAGPPTTIEIATAMAQGVSAVTEPYDLGTSSGEATTPPAISEQADLKIDVATASVSAERERGCSSNSEKVDVKQMPDVDCGQDDSRNAECTVEETLQSRRSGEESGNSSRSSGNEKASGSWSIVSAVNSVHDRRIGAQGLPSAPTASQHEAAKPAGADMTLEDTADDDISSADDNIDEVDGEDTEDDEDVDENWGQWE